MNQRLLPCVNSVLSVQYVQNLYVSDHAVDYVSFVTGRLQKKGSRPIVRSLKSVKGVSCVDQLPSAQPITIIHTVAINLLVGTRLHWKTRGQSQGHKNLQERLQTPLLGQANSDKIDTDHKWL